MLAQKLFHRWSPKQQHTNANPISKFDSQLTKFTHSADNGHGMTLRLVISSPFHENDFFNLGVFLPCILCPLKNFSTEPMRCSKQLHTNIKTRFTISLRTRHMSNVTG